MYNTNNVDTWNGNKIENERVPVLSVHRYTNTPADGCVFIASAPLLFGPTAIFFYTTSLPAFIFVESYKPETNRT
jgi:hypothetical protein